MFCILLILPVFVNFDDSEVFGGKDVLFPDGYARITEYLSRDLDIQLEQIVETVTYGDDGVTIKTNQDLFTADRVIVTLPIGVLKNGTVKFNPPFLEGARRNRPVNWPNSSTGLNPTCCILFCFQSVR